VSIRAWLVESQRGRDAVFLDRALAEKYAVGVRGQIVPLVAGERRHDVEPAPLTGTEPDEPIHAGGES
jgi:hypothetical protein